MKIGFVDYYLDEFHANHYPEWLSNSLGEKPELFAYGEIDSPKEGGLTTKAWCEKYGATRMNSIDEVCRAADYIFLLSPDNPENHLRYAEVIFPYRKPVFMDKTFAVDREDGEKIMELGKRYGTPFFSSSSLRFAPEFAPWLHGADSVVASGAGGHFEVELIHPIEICNCLMGNGAKDLMTNGDKDQLMVFLRYEGNRHATVNFTLKCENLGYSALICSSEKKCLCRAQSPFFQAMTDGIVAFFKNPEKIPVSHEETLEALRIRDAVLKGLEKPYTWVEV